MKSLTLYTFCFVFLLSSCQTLEVKEEKQAQNIEISREISCSGVTPIETLPTHVSQLNLFINDDCLNKTIDEKNWEIMRQSQIDYLYFEPTEYHFSLQEYTIFASLDAKTIAGLDPETKEQGVILRKGTPQKLYEPTGNPLIYTDDERKNCNFKNTLSSHSEQQNLERERTVKCFLSLPNPK